MIYCSIHITFFNNATFETNCYRMAHYFHFSGVLYVVCSIRGRKGKIKSCNKESKFENVSMIKVPTYWKLYDLISKGADEATTAV